MRILLSGAGSAATGAARKGHKLDIANVAATIFLVGALWFAQQCYRAVRTGTARADFGYEFSRGQVPTLYWMLVLMNGLVGGLAATSAYWVLTSGPA
jgi:hypothetical protein